MLLKEIFSKKKKLFREILSQKLLNQTTYEKSYIRRVSAELTSVCLLDNCRSFFNTTKKVHSKKRKGRIKNFRKFELKYKKKKKVSKKKVKTKSPEETKKDREKQIKIKKRSKKKKIKNATKRLRNPYKKRDARIKRIGHKGSSSYTTTFLYQNRKINLIRFKQPICNMTRPINFTDLFLKGLKTLLTGRIKKNDNTLIILEAKRGGFSCYSSGFRGFISKYHFQLIVGFWGRGIKRIIRKTGDLTVLRQFIRSQRFQWSVSPPPRFKFLIRTLVKHYRFRKNKLNLSRKKRTETPTKMLPKFVFISQNYVVPKKGKLLSQRSDSFLEIPFDKYRWAAEGWDFAFKGYHQRCRAFDRNKNKKKKE
jgi:hypothetical protein